MKYVEKYPAYAVHPLRKNTYNLWKNTWHIPAYKNFRTF